MPDCPATKKEELEGRDDGCCRSNGHQDACFLQGKTKNQVQFNGHATQRTTDSMVTWEQSCPLPAMLLEGAETKKEESDGFKDGRHQPSGHQVPPCFFCEE